jgi:hypothetical protein
VAKGLPVKTGNIIAKFILERGAVVVALGSGEVSSPFWR